MPESDQVWTQDNTSKLFDEATRRRIDACLPRDPELRAVWEEEVRRWDSINNSHPLATLASAAQAFCDGLAAPCPYDGVNPTVRSELFLAPRALALSRALELVKGWEASADSRPPRAVQRSVREIDKRFRAIIERWGWQDIISPRGFEIIADLLELHHERYYLPLLRSVLTWGQDLDGELSGYADELADHAEHMGLEADPSVSPDDARKSAGELHELWKSTPALGGIHPDRLPDELSSWDSSLRAIRQYVPEARAPGAALPSPGRQVDPTVPAPPGPAGATGDARDVPRPAVDLKSRDDEPIVHGKPLRLLNKARADVVLALRRAWPDGLSKDELVRISGHDDAVNVLKRLTKKPGWESAFILPGVDGKGRGYRIASC